MNLDIPSSKELTDEQLVIFSPFLKGYSLKLKEWHTYNVDSLVEVDWNTQAFNQLTLPEEFKELIQATIEMQVKRRSDFDDFIHGKGRGLITLLSGSPGVGKTATVEAMSEMLKVPLYHMSAASLGTDVRDIETKLQEILTLTSRWNAILLLDEADIFLEQRRVGLIDHNAIVTSFLQNLEYHEGVLCLTTNRPDTIDRAVISRVHLNLIYPDLDLAARKSVWRRFATATVSQDYELDGSQAHKVEISESELDELAQASLDGRQIKNVFKTACLLAAWKSQPLGAEVLKRALKIVEMQIIPRGVEERIKDSGLGLGTSRSRNRPTSPTNWFMT